MVAAYHETYYATVATVIPLFMILGIFEYRVLVVRPDLPKPLVLVETILMPLLVAIFVGGEACALEALKRGSEAVQWKDDVIILAIAFQLVTIFLMGVTLVLNPLIGRRSWFPNMVDDPQEGKK
jgi:hypothetical protein